MGLKNDPNVQTGTNSASRPRLSGSLFRVSNQLREDAGRRIASGSQKFHFAIALKMGYVLNLFIALVGRKHDP